MRRYRTLLAIITLFACETPYASAGEEPRPVRLIAKDGPRFLDPHIDPTAVGTALFPSFYEPLVAIAAGGRTEPVLATSWEQVDALTWRFDLRAGVRFHDGRRLDAGAVVASIERARTHERGDNVVALSTLAGAEAADATTVIVRLAEEDALVLTKLTGIMITADWPTEAITAPIGTGPYRIKVMEENHRLQFSTFDDYWGSKPSEQLIEIVFDQDPSAAIERLRLGTADIALSIPPYLVEEVERDHGLWIDSALGSSVFYIGLQTQHGPFRDPLLREAVDCMLDRQGIAERAFRNYARPATQLVTDQVFGANPGLAVSGQRAGRARVLVAGTTGLEPVRFTLIHSSDTTATDVAREIERSAIEVGFDVELVSLPWDEFYPRALKGEFEAALLSWNTAPHNDAGLVFAAMTRSTSSGWSQFGQSTPAIDRLIDQSQRVVDMEARELLLHSIAERIAMHRAIVPVVWNMELHAVARTVDWQPGPRNQLHLTKISRKAPCPPFSPASACNAATI